MEARNLVLARWFFTAMLFLLTIIFAAYAIVSAVKHLPWDFATAVVGLVLFAGVGWEPYFAARAGRPSRLAWRSARRAMARKAPGRRFRSIDELQAEYAQSILDDADRDAILSTVLDELAANFLLRRGEAEVRASNPDDLASLTAYANQHVETLSDPDHEPLQRIYRGYSTDLLVVAAACRAADRMRRR